MKTTSGRLCREMLPACLMPRASKESPIAAHNVTPASTRYLRNVTRSFSGLNRFGHGRGVALALLPDRLVPRSAELEEAFSILVKTHALPAVEYCLLQNAVNGFWPEVVFVVEAVQGLHDFIRRQPRILDLG